MGMERVDPFPTAINRKAADDVEASVRNPALFLLEVRLTTKSRIDIEISSTMLAASPKTLQDLVKGIRASKRDTTLYISACLQEIRTELNAADVDTKSNALLKLIFLQMLGYSMASASFPTIEVMSSSKFAHKRIGYLAAVRSRIRLELLSPPDRVKAFIKIPT